MGKNDIVTAWGFEEILGSTLSAALTRSRMKSKIYEGGGAAQFPCRTCKISLYADIFCV